MTDSFDVPLEVRGDLTPAQLQTMRFLDLYPAIVERAVDAQSEEWRSRHVREDGTVRSGLAPFLHGWAGLWVDGEEIAQVEWKQFCPAEDPKMTVIPAEHRSRRPQRPES